MNFGGFLDNNSGGGGARIVADISVNNNSSRGNNENNNNDNNMPTGAISQTRLLPQSIAKTMFNFLGVSLALQTGMEGQNEVTRMAKTYEGNNNVGRRSREEEPNSRSGSDNLEGASGDEQDVTDEPPRKKRYHRHTPQQIQEILKISML